MRPKLPIVARPADLRYDHGESLPGGAQFARLDTLEALRSHWEMTRAERPYACCGTGANSPAYFLRPKEWVFAPTVEALVAAVTRWDEFGIAPRWYDAWSDESEVHDDFAARRAARRSRRIAEGRWSGPDEIAYRLRSEKEAEVLMRGHWRLANLPCGLTHFDWLSEHAKAPSDPALNVEEVAATFRRLTYVDWKDHQTQDDVFFMFDTNVDDEIAHWEGERESGRASYED